MKTCNIQIRVPAELRERTDKVLSGVGVDMTTAIRMFMNQIVYTNSIPFEIKLPQSEIHHLEVVEVAPEIQLKMDKVGVALDKALKKAKK